MNNFKSLLTKAGVLLFAILVPVVGCKKPTPVEPIQPVCWECVTYTNLSARLDAVKADLPGIMEAAVAGSQYVSIESMNVNKLTDDQVCAIKKAWKCENFRFSWETVSGTNTRERVLIDLSKDESIKTYYYFSPPTANGIAYVYIKPYYRENMSVGYLQKKGEDVLLAFKK